MKLTPPHFNHMPNAEHFQIGTDKIRAVEKFGAKALDIEDEFNDFKSWHQKEDEVLNRINKSEFTELIRKADSKGRDWAFASMTEINSAYLRHHDEDILASAKRLDILFNTPSYKNLQKQSILKQTANTRQLLQELTGKYLADTKAVKIDEWVTRMAFCNDEVQALMDTRIDESALKDNTNLRALRKSKDDSYDVMAERINALWVLRRTPELELFIRTMNEITAKYGGSRQSTAQPDNNNTGSGDKYPNAREWSADIDYQTCASGDIFYIVRNGVKEYYKLLDFGEVATFEPGMDDGGIWEKIS